MNRFAKVNGILSLSQINKGIEETQMPTGLASPATIARGQHGSRVHLQFFVKSQRPSEISARQNGIRGKDSVRICWY
jgi:hypothetical protein